MTEPRCIALVVDDDAAMRNSLGEVLAEAGHTVVSAANGAEALEVLRAQRDIRVVLLDVMMPVMNGLEFLAAKGRDERISRVPVVLMTAFEQQARQIVGVESVFGKPFETEALLREVRRLCEARRARVRVRSRSGSGRQTTR